MTKTKTSKEDHLDWAQKAYNKLKASKNIKYRSKLEERIASLLEGLGVSYEYESTKIPYTIQHNYHPRRVCMSGKRNRICGRLSTQSWHQTTRIYRMVREPQIRWSF